MNELLDADELGELLDGFTLDLFRMEALPEYAVESDGNDFQRWLDGAAEPTWTNLNGWLEILRAERAAGKISRRVRIFSARLTDYERYASEFGYLHTARAGEDIRVLRRGEHDIPAGLIEQDFWVLDDRQVVAMHYDTVGRFEGAQILGRHELAQYLRTQQAAWEAGEPFLNWWSRHPELHRRLAA
jgi:hypothetical protein